MQNYLWLLLSVFFLSGCLYPDEQRAQDTAPNEEQLAQVQTAVESFQENTQVLPIETRDAATPAYRRYPVQFSQLVPQYLNESPPNAFENGGKYQYVLIEVEETPQVKLIDLAALSDLQSLQTRLTAYRRSNDYAPILEVAGPELLKLDYSELGYEEEPTVESPFHPTHRLPLLYTTDGEIVVDYRLDILHYIDEYGMEEYETGENLLPLLTDHAPFVPFNSVPQVMNEEGEIEFRPDLEQVVPQTG
ncbi:hypothetical protein [Alkalicoccus urumqiensis]|uniref:ABC transporter periplasmic binding protein yphF n=1 Tax=Alkalicoccus urumqiensis TaxID=1548213 RepID=A0A2P6MKH5_ALKUR|nr:hypothetical protein [Alkalicoccus urumqiensis]PRO66802.1 hypothetical protein C6I21_02450 [Alkalicoccus urumqiensis]